MLLPSLTGWRSQYELMKRTYARLSEAHVSSIDYDDDLQHFFQDCWHLKDWIKNDRSLTLTSKIKKKSSKKSRTIKHYGSLPISQMEASIWCG